MVGEKKHESNTTPKFLTLFEEDKLDPRLSTGKDANSILHWRSDPKTISSVCKLWSRA